MEKIIDGKIIDTNTVESIAQRTSARSHSMDPLFAIRINDRSLWAHGSLERGRQWTLTFLLEDAGLGLSEFIKGGRLSKYRHNCSIEAAFAAETLGTVVRKGEYGTVRLDGPEWPPMVNPYHRPMRPATPHTSRFHKA